LHRILVYVHILAIAFLFIVLFLVDEALFLVLRSFSETLVVLPGQIDGVAPVLAIDHVVRLIVPCV
jgi:uncharacterized protein YoxC